MEDKPTYSFNLDKIITWIINTIFFWRLPIVLIAMGIVVRTSVHVWQNAPVLDKYKDISIVFGLGAVSIGIFYSILNYEHNLLKSKKDAKAAKYTLSFNSVCDWHRPTMVSNLKITKQLFDQHKHLINEDRGKEFFEILEQNEDARSALVSIFNYFEVTALGVKMGLLDEEFVKLSLKGVAQYYISHFGFYINYRRQVHLSPTMWVGFTEMVDGWKN